MHTGESKQPIGIFDSGIGGLTVARELMRHLPYENIVYFGDTARVPYGSKSEETIKEYALQDARFLMTHNVKMIVVACNTVASVALQVVQKKCPVPVVGVILPATQAAVKATRMNKIGVIGTQTTIASCAYVNAIHALNPKITVVAQACPLFVSLAEEGWTHHRATYIIASEYLLPMLSQRIDTLMLGCTHYPLLRDVIQTTVSDRITLIDSGAATAAEVERILVEHKLKNPSTARPNHQFYVSDFPQKFQDVSERFLGRKLGRVVKVSVA
jgi:glutamate racemase